MIKKLLFLIGICLLSSCQNDAEVLETSSATMALLERSRSLQKRGEQLHQDIRERYDFNTEGRSYQDFLNEIDDDAFVDVSKLSTYFILDIKYATKNNFLKKAVYDCAACYLKGSVAKALINANKEFMKKGYRMLLYDCYRPLDVQKKMWTLVSDPNYVADPDKGSVHNRGAAIDLTLTNLKGEPLDMGTEYDHFGEEAHHSFTDLKNSVKSNREFLKSVMETQGFHAFETEWWHYDFKNAEDLAISNFKRECENR